MERRRASRGGAFSFTLALVTLVLVSALAALGNSQVPTSAASALNWRYKNFTMASYWNNDLYNSQPALQQMAHAGATSVTFTVTWYTDNTSSTNIYGTQATASDDSLVWAIQQAHALGLQVLLKPHLDPLSGEWRAYINPTDAATWFTNYAAMIDHYADIGAQQGALVLCIGAELVSMSTNATYDGRWRSLIADVRGRFGGQLTYSANWGDSGFNEEYPHILFWGALDYLGISAYFQLANDNSPTVVSMNARWQNYKQNRIVPFQQRWSKPVLFTEVGYRSADYAAEQPWNNSVPNGLNTQQQADCYEAFFESWANVPWFAGAEFWNWSTDANVSASSTGYEIQNKPAYDIVSAWFSVAVTPTPAATAIPTTTATMAPTVTPTTTATVPPSPTTRATPKTMPAQRPSFNQPPSVTPIPAPSRRPQDAGLSSGSASTPLSIPRSR